MHKDMKNFSKHYLFVYLQKHINHTLYGKNYY